MSYNFYSLLHMGSLFALALILGGLWGLYAKEPVDKKLRAFLLGLHGLLMFLIFLAGFGLIAKAKIPFPWPFWIYGKLLVWTALGAAPFMIKRAGRRVLQRPKFYVLILCLIFALMFFALCLVRFKWTG